jgi:hypothetical protein
VKKDDPSSLTKSEIAKEILAYLAEHPDAQDTLEGIVQWWLLERKVMYQTKAVAEALADLVSERFVLEIKDRDLESRYRINRQKLKAM